MIKWDFVEAMSVTEFQVGGGEERIAEPSAPCEFFSLPSFNL